MKPEQWQKIQDILTLAGEQPEEIRPAWLRDQAAGESPEFLEELLAYYAAMDEESGGSAFEVLPTDTPMPETIGPYAITEQIGEGGMGIVYLGTQPETHRQVAVKVMRSGWHAQLLVRRFLVEYQALARLNQPHIASIIEAGTTQDRLPWFSMEYAPGIAIDEYCTKHQLDLQRRIALFLQVVSAVAHAHAKAIIHRDIKPSNVLVIEADSGPAVKLIDFGIALPMGENNRVTHTHQIIGTPAFMSPEQITNPLGIDTRADVYALGALLFVMLTERTPFEDAEDVLSAVRKQEPPRPSIAVMAGIRKLLPAITSSMIKGDLDAIILQAMQKNPDMRYQSARELADDLERWQTGQPVKAVKPTRWYSFQKYFKRHRTGVISAATVLLTILVALFISINRTIEAQHQAKRAEKVRDFFTETFGSASPFDGAKDIMVIEAMDQAAGEINTRFAGDPETLADIHAALANTYHKRGALEQALHHAEQLKRIAPTEEQKIEADLITILALRDQEKHAEAEALCMTVISKTKENSPEWLKANLYRAHSIREQTRLDEAAQLYQDILPKLRHEYGNGDFTLRAMRGLATTRMQQGDYNQALTLYQEVLALQQAEFGEEHPRTLATLNSLAQIYMHLGEHEDSLHILRSVLAIREKILGEAHPSTLKTRINIGSVLYHSKKYELARNFAEETVQLHQQYLGFEAQETLKAQNNFTLIYEALGANNQAIRLYEEILKTRRETLGVNHPDTLTSAHNLGSYYITLGKFDRAESLLREIWQTRISVYGADHIRSLFTCFTLGECYVEMKRYDAALPLLEQAYTGMLKIHDPTHEYSVIFAGYLGYVRCKLGNDPALLDFALEHASDIEPKYKKKLEEFAEDCDRAGK